MKRYHFRIDVPKEKSLDYLAQGDSKRICDSVRDAAILLNSTGARWHLVGALGTYMQLGVMVRNHQDIDIEIERKQIPQLIEGIKGTGYELLKRFLITKIAPNTYLHIHTTSNAEDCVPERKTLRLVNKDSSNPMLQSLDIKISEATPQGTIIGDSGRKMLIDLPYEGPEIEIGGQKIRTRNIRYHQILKSLSKSEVNQFDLRKIETFLKPQTV
jgi:hypothetical protein